MSNPAIFSNASKPLYAVQIVDLNKWYGSHHVLKNISLTVRTGERIVIAGPSGSG